MPVQTPSSTSTAVFSLYLDSPSPNPDQTIAQMVPQPQKRTVEVYIPSRPTSETRGEKKVVGGVYSPTGPLALTGKTLSNITADMHELLRLRSHHPSSSSSSSQDALTDDTHTHSDPSEWGFDERGGRFLSFNQHGTNQRANISQVSNSSHAQGLQERREKIRMAVRRRNARKLEVARGGMGRGFGVTDEMRVRFMGVRGVDRVKEWADECVRVGCQGWPEGGPEEEEGDRV